MAGHRNLPQLASVLVCAPLKAHRLRIRQSLNTAVKYNTIAWEMHLNVKTILVRNYAEPIISGNTCFVPLTIACVRHA